MFSIFIHPRAEKSVLRINKTDRLKILNTVSELQTVSHPLQHKRVIKLEGYYSCYRLRVGDYRVKFEWRKPGLFFIYQIENRQAGY